MKEHEDDLKLLEEVLQDCHIKYKDAKDSKINGKSIDEYAKTINRIIILGDNNERIR